MLVVNSMVKYVVLLNLGFLCGLFSFNLEYLDKYSIIMNKVYMFWVLIYSYVNVVVIYFFYLVIFLFVVLVFKIFYVIKFYIMMVERRDIIGLRWMLNVKL